MNRKPAYAAYVLALPLLLIGFALVGVGLFASLKGDDTSNTPTILEVQADNGANQAPSLDQEAIQAGERLYQSTCAACHGSNLEGLRGIGSNLITSEFVQGQTDEDLQAFIMRGRPSWDAANTTGVDMPPRGGNPALTESQIQQIIAFIRLKGSE